MSRWRDAKKGNKNSTPSHERESNDSTTLDENLASIPARIKAFITDSFLITTPIFYVTIYFIMGSGAMFSQNKASGWIIIFGTHFIAIMLFWVIKGQTPGLKAYEGLLVDAKTKKKISIVQAFVRYVITLLSILSFFGMFLPFLRKDKKTLQDLLSNTCIVHEPSD